MGLRLRGRGPGWVWGGGVQGPRAKREGVGFHLRVRSAGEEWRRRSKRCWWRTLRVSQRWAVTVLGGHWPTSERVEPPRRGRPETGWSGRGLGSALGANRPQGGRRPAANRPASVGGHGALRPRRVGRDRGAR